MAFAIVADKFMVKLMVMLDEAAFRVRVIWSLSHVPLLRIISIFISF